MKDRFINGVIAGTVGAVIQNIYGLIGKAIHWPELVYTDYGRIVLFFRNERGSLASFLGLAAHFVWDILIALFFIFLIKKVSSRYIYGKGIIYAAVVWYLIKLGANVLRIPYIENVSPQTVGFFFLGALLYGVVIVYTLKKLEPENHPVSGEAF